MAVKVPLNKFRSVYIKNITGTTAVYGGQRERATIVIQAQATNPTSQEHTCTLSISSKNTTYSLVEDFVLPPKDAVSLLTGRLVIQGIDGTSIFEPDVLLFSSSSPDIVLSLGILETKNTD
jgi:hypothetical protein